MYSVLYLYIVPAERGYVPVHSTSRERFVGPVLVSISVLIGEEGKGTDTVRTRLLP